MNLLYDARMKKGKMTIYWDSLEHIHSHDNVALCGHTADGYALKNLRYPGYSPCEFCLNLLKAAPLMYEALANLENDDASIPEHAWKLVQAALDAAGGEG